MASELCLAASKLLTEFEADLAAQALARSTIQQYTAKVRRFLIFLEGEDIGGVNQESLKAYMAHLRRSGMEPTTLTKQFVAIGSLFVYLESEGRVASNPVPTFRRRYLKALKREAGKSEIALRQLISVEDMRRLAHTLVDARDRAVVVLFAKTGIRASELLSLDVEDINWKEQSIRLKKKRKRTNRTVYFDDEAARVIKRWLPLRKARGGEEKGALFTGTHGRRLQRNAFLDMIVKPAESLGFHDASGPIERRFSAHCLRHFFTTHLRRAGMTREHVGYLRGDAPRGTMDIYLHIDPAEVKESYLARIPKFGL